MGMIGNSLAQGLISGANIQDGTVDTPDIKDSAVTAAKIASAVITPGKLSTGAPTWDTSGNVGLGVTPSAWSGVKALEIAAAGSGIYSFGSTDVRVTGNAYWNGSAYKYGATNLASMYVQNSGIHYWYNAASGTAGNSISFTTAMTLDASGNLMVGGTTPTNASTGRGNIVINGASTSILNLTVNSLQAGYLYHNGTDLSVANGKNGHLVFYTNDTERARIDNTGKFGIGVTNPSAPLTIASTSTAAAIHIRGRSDGYGDVIFYDSTGSTQYGFVEGGTTGLSLSGVGATSVIFGTNGVDRGRIASNGFTHFTSDGQYYNSLAAWHSMETNAQDNPCIFINRHASGPYGPFIYFTGASPNSTSRYFLAGSDTTNDKFFIYSNGTFGSRTSTYGGISDVKVKQDIVDASSQWNDIKALRFRKYRFKDDPTGPLQLGLISQEAELVSPGLVFETPDTERDEEGNRVETGEVTKSVKYSILYMKAVVALQEAMNRIEQLEIRLAALEGA